MTKKIIFISHSASQSGAPIVLLNFLRWFKQNTEIPFITILARDGALKDSFEAISPVLVYDNEYDIGQRKSNRRRFRVFQPQRQLKRDLAKDDIGLIYSNTVANHEILSELQYLDCPILTHIHELEYAIFAMAGEKFDQIKMTTSHYLVASNAVKTNLVTQHKIDDRKITVVHESICIGTHTKNDAVSEREKKRSQLGIASDDFVVGAAGAMCWRKGTDLFVQTAQIMRQRYPHLPVKFIWVGGDQGQHIYRYEMQYDVEKLGLEEIVYFLGEKSNPLGYFSTFDVFTLLSREDPYPLVCLEAALLEKPIICFADAGGEPEFVEDDCGFVVPYMDLDAVADKIFTLSESPQLRQQMGEQASKKVRKHHSVDSSAKQILAIIQRYLP